VCERLADGAEALVCHHDRRYEGQLREAESDRNPLDSDATVVVPARTTGRLRRTEVSYQCTEQCCGWPPGSSAGPVVDGRARRNGRGPRVTLIQISAGIEK